MKEYLLKKAGEPSTWKGLGWLLVAVGLLPAGAIPALVSVGAGVVGLVEVIRNEK